MNNEMINNRGPLYIISFRIKIISSNHALIKIYYVLIRNGKHPRLTLLPDSLFRAAATCLSLLLHARSLHNAPRFFDIQPHFVGELLRRAGDHAVSGADQALVDFSRGHDAHHFAVQGLH